MVSNYFTLSALAREWSDILPGAVVRDVYSPDKDELAIELAVNDAAQSIRISVSPGFHFIFRALRTGRPRSNVTTLFDGVIGSAVEHVSISPSDRILSFGIGNPGRLDIHLYGSRANVLLVAGGNGERIEDAFKQSDRLAGEPPPAPKPLPEADLRDALQGMDDDEPLARLLSRLRPRLAKPYVREWMQRAAIDSDATGPPGAAAVGRLLESLESIMSDLERPSPRTYMAGGKEVLSLIPLAHLGLDPTRIFASVDDAVRETVQSRLASRGLESMKAPLLKALENTLDRTESKIEKLERASATESRADEYEKWGHLLMASPNAGADGTVLTVPDLLSGGTPVEIPIDRDRSLVENAERYYNKARSLRAERGTLAGRLRDARSDREELVRLVEKAKDATDVREIERFRKEYDAQLRRFIGGQSEAAPPAAPFRRFDVGGFEVWVGRNARENDRLTFDHASPHDLWFHARGVGGSHVVLRVPGRKTVVGKPVCEKAAAIAAWFSSARGSKLVPVIMTRRKYVSKSKGSDPGAVRVHREEVLMVEPRLPS